MAVKMKTLLITGGNEGIGYYMARQWLENGNCAAILDLNCSNIDKLKESYPQSLLTFTGDVRDIESMKAAVDQTAIRFGSIDYAVHNACLCLFKNFSEHGIPDFDRVMDVNFHGAVHLIKAVLPVMENQKQGKIFLTSSGVGITGYVNIGSYACSKGAIESLAKCLSIEYADSGITFHILHPPLTDTKSSSPLPVPREFKASPEKVGRGFIKRMDGKGFIITPSFGDAISVKLSYLFPLFMGRMLVKMTKKAENNPG